MRFEDNKTPSVTALIYFNLIFSHKREKRPSTESKKNKWKVFMKRIIAFFLELFQEIRKAVKPIPEPTLTLGEFKEILEGKNKNELMDILIRIGADIDRDLPAVHNRKELKQKHSKRQIIKAIMLLVSEKYRLGEQYGNIKRIADEQKDRGVEGLL